MSLFLTKLLPVFAYPLGATLALGVVVFALLVFGFLRTGRALLLLLVIVLWVPSTPFFANWISLRLESEYPPTPIDALPQRDTIVLLGGILGQPLPPRVAPDLEDAADRITEALRLYRAGKAPVIVVSGANLPWTAAVAPEAELVANYLVELGVPRSALVLEAKSRNTYENGVNTAAIFEEKGWRNALLVTSGTHMPRAVAVFRSAGIDVTPAATDIHGRLGVRISLFGVLPDARALAQSTLAIKELMGLYAYRWLGWV